MGTFFQGIGALLIILGVVDFITGTFLGKDFTGVWWSPLALGGVGSLLMRIGNSKHKDSIQYEQAVQSYDEIIDLNPQDADAYYNRGIAYQGLGEDERAERDFQKAKELGYTP